MIGHVGPYVAPAQRKRGLPREAPFAEICPGLEAFGLAVRIDRLGLRRESVAAGGCARARAVGTGVHLRLPVGIDGLRLARDGLLHRLLFHHRLGLFRAHGVIRHGVIRPLRIDRLRLARRRRLAGRRLGRRVLGDRRRDRDGLLHRLLFHHCLGLFLGHRLLLGRGFLGSRLFGSGFFGRGRFFLGRSSLFLSRWLLGHRLVLGGRLLGGSSLFLGGGLLGHRLLGRGRGCSGRGADG